MRFKRPCALLKGGSCTLDLPANHTSGSILPHMAEDLVDLLVVGMSFSMSEMPIRR